jgi:hypothetical protein
MFHVSIVSFSGKPRHVDGYSFFGPQSTLINPHPMTLHQNPWDVHGSRIIEVLRRKTFQPLGDVGFLVSLLERPESEHERNYSSSPSQKIWQCILKTGNTAQLDIFQIMVIDQQAKWV